MLVIKNVHKKYVGAKALNGVSLEIPRGEIVGLFGENGAGKSTLMKILTGVYTKDEGTIEIDGKSAEIQQPSDASNLGIRMIFQEFSLIPTLTVVENIFLKMVL